MTTLLVILPFGGIRVVCLEVQAEPDTAPVGHHLDECEQLCALHGPAGTPLPSDEVEAGSADTRQLCALTSDGARIDCVSFTGVAIVRGHDAPQTPAIARDLYVESSRLHLDPALTPAGPPPKHRAL